MASFKNCLAVLFGASLFIASSMSEGAVEASSEEVLEESSCSFNDDELVPDERSPYDMSRSYIWPNGEIPYVFTNTVIDTDRALIEKNMRKIEQRSCFRFKKQYRDRPPTDRKYLEIDIPANAGSCKDGRGYNRFAAHVTNKYLVYRTKNALLLFSQYKLTDKYECRGMAMYEGGILHEMFHALGVGHTQRRRDRDNYIRVNRNNIQKYSQYEICRECKVYGDIPYECDSIMHYGYMTFAKGRNQPTMTARNSRTCQIGPNGPSIPTGNDWKLIKRIGETVCGSSGGSGGSGGSGSTGKWSAWENYGYCEGTCQRAIQKQRRRCVGGTGCRGSSTRSAKCQKPGCKRCNGQDSGCCTYENPCGENEGDCDNNEQCQGNLKCGNRNCPWGGSDDCCWACTGSWWCCEYGWC